MSAHHCEHCGMTSHHPVDVDEGYCGNCHHWCAEVAQLQLVVPGVVTPRREIPNRTVGDVVVVWWSRPEGPLWALRRWHRFLSPRRMHNLARRHPRWVTRFFLGTDAQDTPRSVLLSPDDGESRGKINKRGRS